MKLTQNQYYGLKSDLPSFLREGSVFLCSDTKEMYIYIEGDVPFKLVEGEKEVITRDELNEAIAGIPGGGGGSGTLIVVVSNYSLLPNPATVSGKFYYVNESQGSKWLPGNLGGSYYPKGIYYSNGTSWSFVESPYQSSQIEVDSGVNNDKFITPLTLNNYSKWNTKYDSSNPSGYISSVPAQTFASITNKPFTLYGYGITDAYPLSGNPSGFLNSYTETDPVVRAVNGIVKSNGSVISAAISGTDYVIPSGTVNSANTLVGLTTSIAILNNQSGVNTGDQTSIVGITGTKAQFDSAITDGNVQFVGDTPTFHTHTLTSGATDVTITASNLNTLDDNSNSALHFHDSDRSRDNHTGTQAASTISDIQSTITNNTSVLANTAKITNATHTGDATGDSILTISSGVVTNAKLANIATKTYKGRTSALTGVVEDVSVASLKSDLSLNLVDNTSDINKPISTAAQNSLNSKKTDLMNTARLLGRSTAGNGVIEEIALGTNLSFSGNVLNATSSGGGAGGITRSVSNVLVNATAGAVALTDYVFFITGTVTLTLPTAIANTNMYTIKCISGIATVACNGVEKIDGASTIQIAVEDSVDLISNNTEWKVV